jgi:hypothetical protein
MPAAALRPLERLPALPYPPRRHGIEYSKMLLPQSDKSMNSGSPTTFETVAISLAFFLMSLRPCAGIHSEKLGLPLLAFADTSLVGMTKCEIYFLEKAGARVGGRGSYSYVCRRLCFLMSRFNLRWSILSSLAATIFRPSAASRARITSFLSTCAIVGNPRPCSSIISWART